MEVRASNTPAQASHAYQQMKSRVHQLLLGRLDLEAMEGMTPERLREELTRDGGAAAERGKRRRQRARTAQPGARHPARDARASGPLEPLLADPTISDILVNGARQVYVERRGQLEPHRRELRRRRPPDEDHRQDRLARGPPRRRVEPDGRCAAARRLARERDHPAAGARRAGDVDPALFGGAADDGQPDRVTRRSRPRWRRCCRRWRRRR